MVDKSSLVQRRRHRPGESLQALLWRTGLMGATTHADLSPLVPSVVGRAPSSCSRDSVVRRGGTNPSDVLKAPGDGRPPSARCARLSSEMAPASICIHPTQQQQSPRHPQRNFVVTKPSNPPLLFPLLYNTPAPGVLRRLSSTRESIRSSAKAFATPKPQCTSTTAPSSEGR